MARSIGTSSRYFVTNERFTTTASGEEALSTAMIGRPARIRIPRAAKYSGETTRRIDSTSTRAPPPRSDEENWKDVKPPDDTSGSAELIATCVTPGRARRRSTIPSSAAMARPSAAYPDGKGIIAVRRFDGS